MHFNVSGALDCPVSQVNTALYSERCSSSRRPRKCFRTRNVPRRFSSSESSGLTQRLAAISSRRPRRTLAIWVLVVLLALVLAGTSLKGLTTTSHVVGATQSSQAENLYKEVVGSESQKPSDVIVVSSKTSTASDQDWELFVGGLEAEVGDEPRASPMSCPISARVAHWCRITGTPP